MKAVGIYKDASKIKLNTCPAEKNNQITRITV